MKQVILNFNTGELAVEDVPVPALQPGGVLVRNHFSLISAGTETSALDLAGKSLLGKARARPDLAKKVIEKARKDGAITAFQQAMSRLEKPEALGYSCAGEVIAVGEGVTDLRIGDRVACAGVGYASHADVVYVPRNLCVRVPDGAALNHAAFTTVGAIALQGVRIAETRIGERVVVIGLGLLGQLTVQLLKAAGCMVIGVDLDPSKVELARKLGADQSFVRSTSNLKEKIVDKCDGFGADAVLITAGTSSNDPIEFAGDIARDRGRVVAVGAVRMDVPRNLYYEKELSVYLSRSYGPGRYDREYEEEGRDYPIGHVRWTENRNMQAFVELLAAKKLDLGPIVTHTLPVTEAKQAYDILNGKVAEPFVGILLSYDVERPLDTHVEIAPMKHGGQSPMSDKRIRLGVIGAGTFGTSTFLPAAKKVKGIELIALAAATGVTAKKVGSRFGFKYCTTNNSELFADPNIDAVAILTRNSLHAPLIIQALGAGKHVFVEKPLAVTEEELDAIEEAWRASKGHLFVGFNRRYAPYGRLIKEFFSSRRGSMIAHYRINAESIPASHWIYDPKEGGGRLITEVCHFIDFLEFVIGSRPIRVAAANVKPNPGHLDPRITENLVLTIEYADGSIGSILYTNAGHGSFGKEYVEFFADGAVASLRDFRELQLVRDGKVIRKKSWLVQEKGHFEELEAFVEACSNVQTEARRHLGDASTTTRTTFAAARALLKGAPEAVDEG